MIITIDGTSGSGKSTIAKKVADKLGFLYFETGAMYRCFAYYALKNKVDENNVSQIKKLLKSFSFRIEISQERSKLYFVNDEDITDQIRTLDVSKKASDISTIPAVRKKLVALQRNFAGNENTIFEGRDMGTVVFPYADLKIFFSANPEIRAERRTEELKQKYPDQTIVYKEVLDAIKERDFQDMNRKISPLKQAKDAVLIETSDKTIDEIVDLVIQKKEEVEKKTHATLYPNIPLFYSLIIFICSFFAKIFYRHKIYGREHYVPGSGIVAANHVSHFDPPLVAISVPDELYFLAKKDLFSIPVFGKFIYKLNSRPVSNSGSDAQVFREVLKVLKGDKKILLFPEGTRSKTGEIIDLKQGVAFLALRSKKNIFPIYIHGSHKIWEKDKKWPKFFGKTAAIIGKPLEIKKYLPLAKKEAMESITQDLQKSFKELKKWYENGHKGTPP